MRHLKVKATLSRDLQTVLVTVLEQTHFGEHFTPYGIFVNIDFINNTRIVLHGATPKQKRAWLNNGGEGNDVYYLKGDEHDTCSFIIPLHKWKPLKAAIKAYNEEYA